MNKAHNYFATALSGCGFVIVDGQIAAEQRPDLFHTGIEAGGTFDDQARRAIASWPGLVRCTLRLAGIERPLLLYVRWADENLARRVEEIVGRHVVSIAVLEGAPFAAARDPAAGAGRRASRGGTWRAESTPAKKAATLEPPRSQLCASCERLTAGGTCMASEKSGQARPQVAEARRCVAFQPIFQSLDSRTGAQLWPELLAAQPAP